MTTWFGRSIAPVVTFPNNDDDKIYDGKIDDGTIDDRMTVLLSF